MRPLFVLAAATVAAAGCRPRDSTRVSDSTFIATMVDLRRLPTAGAGDSAVRAAILRRRGVTAAALERAARDLAADPKRAARVWSAIEQRETPPTAPSMPTPPVPAPTPVPPRGAPKAPVGA
jgi:hypothetical protein